MEEQYLLHSILRIVKKLLAERRKEGEREERERNLIKLAGGEVLSMAVAKKGKIVFKVQLLNFAAPHLVCTSNPSDRKAITLDQN